MQYKKFKLKNGIRVISVPMKGNPTCTVLTLVEAGSKYETKQTSGLSHFLEHMYFKGTEKRKTPKDISHELDALGSVSNAFTSFECTGYYAKGSNDHVEKFVDIISDIYKNSTLPEEEITKEKGVIIEEINMYEDTPKALAPRLLYATLYGDQPAGWDIIGTKETVLSFSRKDFIKYRDQHYVPEATVVVIAGDVKSEKALSLANKYFGDIKKSKKQGKKKVIEKQSAPVLAYRKRTSDQTHIALGFRSFDLYDKRNTAVHILATILGRGMSSRLFVKMREEMGVCYYVRAGNDTLTDHGVFEINAGVDTKRLEEVVKEILIECKRMTVELVDKKELDKAKEYAVGTLGMSVESSDDAAMHFGGAEVLREKILTPEEIEKKIRKVSAKDVQDVAKLIFREQGLNLAVVGPGHDEVKLKKGLRLNN